MKRKTKRSCRKWFGVFVTVCLLCGMLSGAVATNAATFYTGITLSRSDYDYAPSVMYGDGTQIKMWWGGGTGSGDAVYYATLASTGWSSPKRVLTKSSSGWDAKHVCDPSVIKGSFSYAGKAYSYAMYYTGTYDNVGYDSHIGVAFSNDGVTWVKYPNPVVSPIGSAVPSTKQYGAGMPSAYIANGVITMTYHDSTGAANNIYMVTSTDGINFTNKTLLPSPAGQHTGDIAYAPSEGKWYVSTKSAADTEIYLYKTANSSLSSSWNLIGCVSSATTGKARNHNPGWLRYPNGDIYVEGATGYKYVYYGAGTASYATWDIGQSVVTDSWEFNIPGDRQGWTAANISDPSGPNATGQWIFSTNTNDPHLDSRAIEFPAAAYGKLQINIANQNSSNIGKVYFKTAAENYYSEDKAVAFICTNGGTWNTITVNMATNAKWTGKITGLRIDPVEAGSGNVVGIDFIRLAK